MRSRIVVGSVWSRLEGPPEVTSLLYESLSIRDPNAEHAYAFKQGRWDGFERFFRKTNGEFLSGFVQRAARAIVAAGHERPEIVWPAAASDSPLTPGLVGVTLAEHQVEAVERAFRMRRMALQCPTRGGKTLIAIEFIRRVGRKTLWVTHTKELLRQTPERFKTHLGIDVGIVAGPTRTDGIVVVAMIQTLHRILQQDKGFFRQFGCLVPDEAHHSGADTWQAVAAECVNADYRLALSGTMKTASPVTDLKIEGAYGPTFAVRTTMDLVEVGFIARPRVVFLQVPPQTYPSYEEVRESVCPSWRADPRQLSRLGGRLFRESYDRGIVFNETRNRAIVDVAVRHANAGERFLVLVNRVSHADAIASAIDARLSRACRVWSLNGECDDDERSVTLTSFRQSKRGAVLVCTPFFREGLDVPEIDAAFLAGGGESSIAVLQAFARALTKRPGKDEVIIYDCLDGRDPRKDKDYLANHAWNSRLKIYKEQGFSIQKMTIGEGLAAGVAS